LEGKFPCYLLGLNKSRCFVLGLLTAAIALAALDLLFNLILILIKIIKAIKIIINIG